MPRFIACFSVIVMFCLSGCRGGLEPDESGMRAWVDETGQVRYTPVEKKEEEKSSDGDESEGGMRSSSPVVSSGKPPSGEKQSPDDPVRNLANYPDADEVMKNADNLFYQWFGADGRIYNTPYALAEEEAARVSRPEGRPVDRPDPSEARIIRRDSPSAPAYNPSDRAKQIFGLGGAGGELAAFAETCCSNLSRADARRLIGKTSIGLRLTQDSSVHRFRSGESRFGLVRLKKISTGAMLRVRSFIQDGVFLPSLVFLDSDFEPVRLVKDITFDFTEENWRRYGFLEAFIPLRDPEKEQWVVVFSLERDRNSSTIIKHQRGGTTTIEHSGTGTLQLQVR